MTLVVVENTSLQTPVDIWINNNAIDIIYQRSRFYQAKDVTEEHLI